MRNYARPYHGRFRSHMIHVPEAIRRAPGMLIFGRRIKSIAFTTDVAIIRNINADAVLAVYPFTPQPVITQSLIGAADIPIFVGVGGGITQGRRVMGLAVDAEYRGAIGVVVNSPTANETISGLAEAVDIPVVVTIASKEEDIDARVRAGADILNVSGASHTPAIVKMIKSRHPQMPVMATGGPTEKTILATIEAGADAITYTPPTTGEIFKRIMETYRTKLKHKE